MFFLLLFYFHIFFYLSTSEINSAATCSHFTFHQGSRIGVLLVLVWVRTVTACSPGPSRPEQARGVAISTTTTTTTTTTLAGLECAAGWSCTTRLHCDTCAVLLGENNISERTEAEENTRQPLSVHRCRGVLHLSTFLLQPCRRAGMLVPDFSQG